MVLSGRTLCFATTAAAAPLLCIAVDDLDKSRHLSPLAAPAGLRQWVARTLGTWNAPPVAALSVVRTEQEDPLLTVLYAEGTVAVWRASKAAVRPLCTLHVAAGGDPAVAATFTGMCAPWLVAGWRTSALNQMYFG